MNNADVTYKTKKIEFSTPKDVIDEFDRKWKPLKEVIDHFPDVFKMVHEADRGYFFEVNLTALKGFLPVREG